jgi:hypothetical protein
MLLALVSMTDSSCLLGGKYFCQRLSFPSRSKCHSLADLPMSFCGSFAPDSPLQSLRPSQLRPSEPGRFFIMH